MLARLTVGQRPLKPLIGVRFPGPQQVKITKQSINEKIFLLGFETQFDLCSTFLRFQEYYESPEFKGRIFTLDEYKRWYSEIKGSFSYYTDWSGFNIPSEALIPFLEGKFDPLSSEEQQLLGMFENLQHPYYIIGVSGDLDSEQKRKLINHEIAHGLFSTNLKYKTEVLNTLAQYNLDGFKNWLRSLGGYHESVLDDEVNAYTLFGSDKVTFEVPTKMKEELQVIFNHYLIK